MGLLDYKQLLLPHLQRNSHFRVFEFHLAVSYLSSIGADRLLNIYRFETLPPIRLQRTAKVLPGRLGP